MKRVAAALGAVLGGAAVAAYALRLEPLWIESTETLLTPGCLPHALDGLRILLLTDLHVTVPGERERRVLAALDASEPPELIVWGGDFIGRAIGSVPGALTLVDRVAERFPDIPTLAVFGNAEHKLARPDRAALEAGLETAGVRLLLNAWEPLTLRGETVTVVGVDDPYYGFADLEAALSGAPDGIFTLLLAHSPQLAVQAATAGIDLMLSGHTHGGQVRLPLIGAIKTQNPLSRRLDCGAFDRRILHRLLGRDPGGDLTLFISRGIGLATVPNAEWLAPRFLCRPEIAWLILRCRPHPTE
jgi:predicted MPP superfamily phosphohydrolase